MKFLSSYNINIVVRWGQFSARGGEIPLIPSVGKPNALNIDIDFKIPPFFMIYEVFSGGKIF